jgi:hypothetical protein
MDLQLQCEDFKVLADHLAVAAQGELPYALSLMLNDAAYDTKIALVEDTWPSHVHVYNHNFLSAALVVVLASKEDLEVSIVDRLGRGHLKQHETGGTKTAAKAELAIPITANTTRTASGSRPLPRQIANSVIIDRGRGPVIYAQTGYGKAKRIKAMYVLRPSVTISAMVPFTTDFNSSMIDLTRAAFPKAMAKAMITRR